MKRPLHATCLQLQSKADFGSALDQAPLQAESAASMGAELPAIPKSTYHTKFPDLIHATIDQEQVIKIRQSIRSVLTNDHYYLHTQDQQLGRAAA